MGGDAAVDEEECGAGAKVAEGDAGSVGGGGEALVDDGLGVVRCGWGH